MRVVLQIQGFVDVDWLAHHLIGGPHLNIALIWVETMWYGKVTSKMWLSSVEAKNRAVAKATTELTWMNQVQ